jgi:hypothetical protein
VSALLELAERCEAATGANKMLDEAIYVTLAIVPSRADAFVYPFYAYTASVDAALTLVPEGYGLGCGNMNPSNCRFNAWVMPPPYNLGADIRTGETLALAICAAALRARASQ